MVAALSRELGETVGWSEPHGGFFLWVRLPALVDANHLLERAVAHGVVYVAGEAFFVDGDAGGRNLMRLSFSAPTPARINEGVARLAAAIREERAALSSSSPAEQSGR
jgi:2-aminoadipate transaminase